MMHRSNPFSFSSVELLENPDLEEDILDAWLEEHFIAITDDEDIHEDRFEHFLDITDDGDIPEAKVVEHFAFGANREIIPSLEASLVDQVVLDLLVPTQQPYESSSTQKVSSTLEWVFLIINVLIELLSAAFDQLSSASKPKYALIAMLISFAAAITCIIELAYKAGKERVSLRWQSKLPWFYYPSPSLRRFGTFPEIIGLVCAMLQTVLSAVAYTFYLEHANYPLKVSFWPVVFALGLFCSKFMQNSQ